MNSLFEQYEGAFDEKEDSPKKENAFGYAYSPFALQDAVGEKDVKKIWVEYQKLRLSGIEAEELIHKILGKVRDMLAIGKGASQADLNIKNAFPYNKSKRDLKNWKADELENFYTKLVFIYHESRQGRDLEVALESALISI